MCVKLNRKFFGAGWVSLIGFALMLSACSSAPAAPINPNPRAATPAGNFCKLSVVGNQIQDEHGKLVVLHGANIPTIAEMAASTQPSLQRLQDLADAGAKIVRLPVDDAELVPTFVPEKLAPLIEQANKLGMVVVVRFRNNTEKPVNAQADDAEEFLRLVLSYPIGYTPGLWFEPFDKPINHPRNRGATQAMVDVVRGLKSEAIFLITNIEEDSKDPAKLLRGSNLVYGIYDTEHTINYPTATAPFMLPNWLNSRVPVDDLMVGVIAQSYEKDSPGLNGEIVRKYWQAQNAKYQNNLLGC